MSKTYQSDKKQKSALEMLSASPKLFFPKKCKLMKCYNLTQMKHGYCTGCHIKRKKSRG